MKKYLPRAQNIFNKLLNEKAIVNQLKSLVNWRGARITSVSFVPVRTYLSPLATFYGLILRYDVSVSEGYSRAATCFTYL